MAGSIHGTVIISLHIFDKGDGSGMCSTKSVVGRATVAFATEVGHRDRDAQRLEFDAAGSGVARGGWTVRMPGRRVCRISERPTVRLTSAHSCGWVRPNRTGSLM